MKILIVGQYYYPDNFRINDISKEFAQRGHRVTVLTGLPDYTTGKVPWKYKFFRRRREVVDGVDVIRVPIIARRTGFLFRAVNYLSFLINSTLYAQFAKKDYDIIFSYQSSPVTMANAALTMKKRSGKKLFLYCLDIWPECLKVWNIPERSILFRLVHRYSEWVYRKCDVIGVTSYPFIDYLTQTNHVDPARLVYIPQHSDDVLTAELTECTAESSVIRFAFGGNIGSAQDVECIILAVHRLSDLKCFEVHIYGDGSNLENCIQLVNQLREDQKIIFHGRVTGDELIHAYEKIDAFLLTLRGDNAVGMTMPAKLQEYMALGKPVFAAIDGAAAHVITQAECGMVARASDDRGLADNMRKYIEDPSRYCRLGLNARRYYEEHFTKDVFIDKLEKIFIEMKDGRELCLQEKLY